VWDDEHEVLVVGAGNAALTAALSAHESGRKVLVLERAPHALRGGNSRFSGGLFRFAYHSRDDVQQVLPGLDLSRVVVGTYPEDAYIEDCMRVSGNAADPVLTRVLVKQSFPTMLWMMSVGVAWELSEIFATRSGEEVHYSPGAVVQAEHQGVGLTARLFKAAESRGIRIVYDAYVTQVVRNDDRVVGVVVTTPEGERTLHARATIIAAGGFEASESMRRQRLGESWGHAKVRGTRFNTGDVLRAAIDIGAREVGEWNGCHATPIDATAPSPGDLRLTDKTNRLSYPYSILVNLRGERFLDEGETFPSHTYAKIGRQVLAQPDSRAFQIFDQQTIHLLEARYSTGTPMIADTIAQLAQHMGVPADALTATVHRFNESASDRPFDPSRLDGKNAVGIDPPKSNWAVPLNRPPFVAYPVACGITFTFGGIAIDAQARVLDNQDRPIPGLFATGELTGGFFYRNYPGGAGLMRGAVFGKIAGASASVSVVDELHEVA
jgi:tricarballylate dehydrogenase